MTDKPKTIQEALAEVQRLANLQKESRVAEIAVEAIESNDTLELDEDGAIATGIKVVRDAYSTGKSLVKNFTRGYQGKAVQGTPVPGRGAITSKATDAERTANKVGKATSEHGGKVAGTAAVATAVGAGAGKVGSASTPSSDAAKTAEPKKQSFGQAFSAARKAAGGKGGKFTYGGKEYNTAVKGEKAKPAAKLRNMNPKGPSVSESLIQSFLELNGSNHGNVFEAAKHLSAKQKKIASVAGDKDKIDAEDFKALRSKNVEEASLDHLGGSTITKDPKKYVDPSTPKTPYTGYKGGNAAGSVIDKAKGALDKKGVKEEVEEIVLEDFVEFHLEEGYDINDIVDFIEENYQLDELSRKTLRSYKKKATTSADRAWAKADKEEDKAMSTDGEKYPAKQERHHAAAKKAIDVWRKRDSGLKKADKKLAKEEVSFTESELAYFEQVAKKSPNLRVGKGNEDERGLGDTVDSRDLTN